VVVVMEGTVVELPTCASVVSGAAVSGGADVVPPAPLQAVTRSRRRAPSAMIRTRSKV
jgi:hypothetical protein